MVDPNIFNDVPIFALLDADERQVLAQQVSARNFARGETIFKAGSPGGYGSARSADSCRIGRFWICRECAETCT